ncbi:hypothetical protein PZB74_04220 [Porifericola rhodea]|uniref:hypothetical protein n=1 Tax=Porifericola rhodea TaxID=930972 RepID=UPI002664EB64|nr:hypothetical protein [Porifericola rhodea]WKN32549.1 hypothetical protein PZB74_04220 [Porifericola rhodea]
MKALVVHIGYPKTATTSIQLNLLAALHSAGKIEYLNHLNKESDYLGPFYCRNVLNYVMSGEYTMDVEKELNELKKIDSDISVVSNENISFFCENFSWAYSSGKAVDNVQRLKEVFKDIFDEVKILMTLRCQLTMIPSFYTQQYFSIIGEQPKFKDYGNWITENFGNERSLENLIFNYAEMYKAYKDSFGAENVYVLLFEDLKKDKRTSYGLLGQVFNVSIEFVYNTMVNASQNISKKGKESLYVDNPTLEKVIKNNVKLTLKKILPEDTIVTVGRLFKKLIPVSLLNKQINKKVEVRALTAEEMLYLQSRFCDSNKKLADELSLDSKKLKEYGYILS